MATAACMRNVGGRVNSTNRWQLLRRSCGKVLPHQPCPMYSSKKRAITYVMSSKLKEESCDGETTDGTVPHWKIKMLYDGDCPLCMREVNMLKRRDEVAGNICFVDISKDDYDPSKHANITFEQAMERIHAILPNGKIVTDVAVFRLLYENVGLGWVYSITRFPAVEKMANSLYSLWAKYRLPLTGRSDLEIILQEKQMRSCRDGNH